ncbi:OsmC family protein [Occallatibacter savannae]|uniref:OsmC family protein n=1 Tax=Occallatibacter savannae TaxID=1002691 RepID=UPI00194EDCD4|nr:OsmC family protein [Occallatibacter savannae]
MLAHSDWKFDEVFEGTTEDGKTITMDGNSAHVHGASPMQAVLMALCSCTSVDVVNILKKKRQDLTALRVTAHATQADAPPRVFTHIRLIYAVHGKLSRKAVEDAVSLSKNKYCSVSKMLEKAMTIEYDIVYPDGEPEA